MFVDRQRIDLLNRLIDARVDLAAYVQLRKAKGYMSVSESNHLRDNFFKLNPELYLQSSDTPCSDKDFPPVRDEFP